MAAKDKNIAIEDFDKICRSCLQFTGIADLFEKVEICILSEEFESLLNIKVAKNDGLPAKICTECMMCIINFKTFKNQAHLSNRILQSILSGEGNISLNFNLIDNAEFTEEFVSSAEEQKIEIHNNETFEALKFETSIEDKSDSENNVTRNDTSDSSDDEKRTRAKYDIEANNTFIRKDDIDSEKYISKSSDISNDLRDLCKENITKHEDKPDKRTLVCHICNVKFGSLAELRLHRKSSNHPVQTKSPCEICKKLYPHSKLKLHMRTHTKEKPFQCQICGGQFSLNESLKRHVKIHTGEGLFSCEICGKKFIQKPSLRHHLRTHTGEKPWECQNCGKKFASIGNYKYHMQRYKTDIPKTNKPKSPSAAYQCQICKKFFATIANLTVHKKLHGDKEYLCNACGNFFATHNLLMSHLKVHTGYRPYQCKICNKSFSQSGTLKSHERLHTGERPFVCTICNKSFVQSAQLKLHTRTHTGSKPYTCTYCGKSFAHTGTLTVHIRTHTGETPYMCKVCKKGFHDSSSLKKHVKRNSHF